MRFTALVLFAGVLAGFALVGAGGPRATAAPVPKHLRKAPEGDRAKLQGKWKVESMRLDGKDSGGLPGGMEMMIEFKGDGLTATARGAGQDQNTTAVVKHDASGARRFTTVETRSDRGGNVKAEKDETFGYAFDGDKLLLSIHPSRKGAGDPLKPEPGAMVLVLTRVK